MWGKINARVKKCALSCAYSAFSLVGVVRVVVVDETRGVVAVLVLVWAQQLGAGWRQRQGKEC